jgi:RNA polymerase sigma-70 factor (ECF subfamily)
MNQTSETLQDGEGQLVAALQRGEPEAYRELVEQHSETIYNLALRMMNNPQEAEEVLQDTFISAFRAIDRFEGRSRLSTWLYRIAYNAALMRLRRRELPTTSLDEPLTGEDGEQMPRQLVDWSAIPDDLLLNSELNAVLREAVAGLSEGLRAVFVLRDIEGLSTAETAAALDLTETNVKVRLHRGRMALRDAITEYFVNSGGATVPATGFEAGSL